MASRRAAAAFWQVSRNDRAWGVSESGAAALMRLPWLMEEVQAELENHEEEEEWRI